VDYPMCSWPKNSAWAISRPLKLRARQSIRHWTIINALMDSMRKVIGPICFSIVFLFSVLSSEGQELANTACEKVSAPKYRIGFKSELGDVKNGISIQISFAKKLFNKDDMIKLVKKLRADYCHYDIISATLYDNYKESRDPGNTYVMFQSDMKIIRMRGFYNLDRTTKEEGLDFSLEPGKLTTQVRLKFKDGNLLPE